MFILLVLWSVGMLTIEARAVLSAPGVSSRPIPAARINPRPPTPQAGWPQMAHDAQRTGYTPVEPKTPWRFAWHWKPVDMYSMPNALHPITGGGKVYVPGGNQGLYAVNLATGTTAWRFTSGGYISEAAAYDTQRNRLYVPSRNGRVYRLNPANGAIEASFRADSPIDTAVLLAGDHVYVTSLSGRLYKLTPDLTKVWEYDAGVRSATAPSYSPSRDILIFGTADLYVHAVNNRDGSRKWASKPPTPYTPKPCPLNYLTSPADIAPSYQFGFPVVAESAGVVFVRFRGDNQNDWLWTGLERGKFPKTNAEIKDFLRQNRTYQTLFALSLDTGNEAFVPAVGNGGVDWEFVYNCGAGPSSVESGVLSTIGPMPVVKTFPDGSQAAYIQFRNGETRDEGFPWDGRWDSHPGEMVLSPVAGYQIGDMRFIPPAVRDQNITDEQTPHTMAGNTLFISHWMSIKGITITDRSPGKGSSLNNPLGATFAPLVIRRAMLPDIAANPPSRKTRYVSGGNLVSYCDGRWYDGGGFWMYWKELDPPTQSECYADGRGPGYGSDRPRYTIVSDGYVLVLGHGGDIFALKHS